MRNDRRSVYAQWGRTVQEAMVVEARLGHESIEAIQGIERFASGEGRHGGPTAPQ